MKHFDMVTGVFIKVPFPQSWGIVAARHDALWRLWTEDINKLAEPDGPFCKLKLASVDDDTNAADVDCVRCIIANWDSPEQLDKTIEWCERRMRLAYKSLQK